MALSSNGTDPLALTSDHIKRSLERVRQKQAVLQAGPERPPTGVGGTLARAVPLGIGDLLHAVTQAAGANPMAAGLDAALDVAASSMGAPRPGILTTAGNLANQIAPPPSTPGMQFLEAGSRGAMAGAIGGPAGAVGGLSAGLSQEGASRMGAGPIMQALAGLLGGAAGSGAAMVGTRMGAPNRAASAIRKQAERGGEPARPQIRAAQREAGVDPTAPGRELLGKPGQEIAMQAASEGGEGGARIADAAVSRFNQSTERFLAKVQNTLGKRGDLDVTAALDDAQAAATSGTYERLRPKPVQITPQLAAQLDDPLVQRAYEKGVEIHNHRLDDAGRPVRPYPSLKARSRTVKNEGTFMERTEVGDESFRKAVPLGALDEMKKGLDNLVERGERGEPGGITSREAAAVQGRLATIRTLVDKQVPEYGDVRAVSKGFFDQKDALQFGRELLKPSTTDDLVRQRLGELDQTNPALRIHVKMGLADAFHKGDIPADWASNPQLRARVQSLVTPEEFATLDKQINRAVREQTRAAQVVHAAEPRGGAVEGSRFSRIGFEVFIGLLRSAARDYATEVSSKTRFNPKVRTQLADVLNASGPDFVTKADDILRRLNIQQSAGPRGAAGAGAAIAGRRE